MLFSAKKLDKYNIIISPWLPNLKDKPALSGFEAIDEHHW
jgi:hypothetical protein